MEDWWNLEVIHYFMKVAEYKNITAAANELFITQPSLSHQMQRIESRLGLQLYTRASRGIVLTEQGEQFYACCKKLMAAYNEFNTASNSIKSTVTGTLRIGYPKAAEDLIIRFNKLFTEKYPDVTIRSIRQSEDNYLRLLSQGDLDLFYAHALDVRYGYPNLQSIRVGAKPFSVLMSASNPLADRESVHLSELKDQRFIAPGRVHAPGRVELLFQKCRENHFVPNVVGYFFQQTDYIISILTSDRTIAIQACLPDQIKPYDGKVKYVKLEGYEPEDELRLTWSAGSANPLVPLYVKLTQAAVEQTRSDDPSPAAAI